MSEEIFEALPEARRDAGVAGPTEYRGNTNDLIAYTAAISGLTFCGFMASNGLMCCLPVLLGAAGLALAKGAQDPVRARNLSLIGLVSAVLLIVVLLACFVAYFAFIIFMSMSTGGRAFD